MFSSNQILEISGSMDQLKKTIEFALDLEDSLETFSQQNSSYECVYQITKDNKYLLGWASKNQSIDGWSSFPFDFNLDIISMIIAQHCQKVKLTENMGDGAYHNGFLLKSMKSNFDNSDNIKNKRYAIISIEPFLCFYAK